MPVSFYDFKRLHSVELQKNALLLFSEIIEQNSYIDGKYNKIFETEFAKHQQAKHCILVANGTDAIELALEAKNIGTGDKVGIPGITFHATAEAVLNRGAEPVLIDVDPLTGLISIDSLKRILSHTFLKAIIPVHIYGLPAPISKLEQICRPRGITIIEDGAQAHGTLLDDGEENLERGDLKPVGSSDNLTTFSFYPTKNLGAFGDAGAILTQSDDDAQKLLSLRNHGRSSRGLQFFGRNSRCDHFQAAILYLKLPSLKEHNKRRTEIAGQYLQLLSSSLPELGLPGKNFLHSSSWHLFPILLKNREQKLRLKDHLERKQIASTLFYERSLGEERPLLDIPGERTLSTSFAEKVLCLPIHPCLEEDEVTEVVEGIKEFLA
ncbi:MAG: DegT/DnrJ/EryC1/StrS family aminotransferase [Oligoflexia bacterium]|nr:DegT/DnrJ/EryC1/StrS family aminotransferase [Oligoflexia bacterium]